jgi:hypothetical protein
VPIAVFWWNDATKELLPLAIQVFQKHHPTENPLVTPKDGLLWEAAKISTLHIIYRFYSYL